MTPDFTVRPSQLINILWVFIGGFAVSASMSTEFYWIALVALIPIYKIIDYACWTYDIYDDRIVESRGVFSVTTREVYALFIIFIDFLVDYYDFSFKR